MRFVRELQLAVILSKLGYVSLNSFHGGTVWNSSNPLSYKHYLNHVLTCYLKTLRYHFLNTENKEELHEFLHASRDFTDLG